MLRTTDRQPNLDSTGVAERATSRVGSPTPPDLTPGENPDASVLLVPVRLLGRVVAFSRVDATDSWVLDFRWRLNVGRYATRSDGRHGSFAMHREILGLSKDDPRVVDHIDHDGLNNTRANLRAVTKQQNAQHIDGLPAHNSTGHRNVVRVRDGFGVVLQVMGRQRWFGRSHKTIDEAARVAEAARASLGFLGSETETPTGGEVRQGVAP